MLTQEQADSLHIKALNGQAVDLTELIKHAYAAGAKDMQERCARVCDSVNNYDNPMTATDCVDAIRALKETK